MKIEIKVPSMGESISEATIGSILKPSGSSVRVDDELLELETDKVNQALYASHEGVITLTVKQGDVVKIGDVIGLIDDVAKGAVEEPKAAEVVREPSKPQPAPTPTASAPIPQPDARQTKEAFIADIKNVEKEIVKDVVRPVQVPTQPSSTSGERVETHRKMSKIRRVIAKRLVESQQTTAMLTTFNEIDMSHVIELREKHKEAFIKKFGVKLGFMSFFVEATVAALKVYPDINSYIDGDDIVHREYYDIGIAVGTEKGVIVPVVRNCDTLTFAGIESAIESFAKKAREGTISIDALQGGGFTITNGGVYGSLLSTPILNPPQSGILGMHKIEKRAVVVDDQIVIRPMMYVALSYDHRIVDGKEAVSFLVFLKQKLEDTSRLLLDL